MEEKELPIDANFFVAADVNANADKASDEETETQSSADLFTKQMRDAENVLLRFDARSTRKMSHLFSNVSRILAGTTLVGMSASKVLPLSHAIN